MRTITNQPLYEFDGETQLTFDNRVPITLFSGMLKLVGAYQTTDGEERIAAYALGLKIYGHDVSVDLEDAEYKLLLKILSAKTMAPSAIMGGQISQILKESHTKVE